jgi:hypothetical protein
MCRECPFLARPVLSSAAPSPKKRSPPFAPVMLSVRSAVGMERSKGDALQSALPMHVRNFDADALRTKIPAPTRSIFSLTTCAIGHKNNVAIGE